MLYWRLKILKDASWNTLFSYKRFQEFVDTNYSVFEEDDFQALNVEEKDLETLKKLSSIQEVPLNYLKPTNYGEFWIFQKGEIRYFNAWKWADGVIVEITTKEKMFEQYNNYIKNIEYGFVSNLQFRNKTEEIITLNILKNNKEKLNNIFIENSTLSDNPNDIEKVFNQKLEVFYNEKKNLNYEVERMLLNNYYNTFDSFYWKYLTFYQNLFLKNWNNFYPIKMVFKNTNWIVETDWFKILWDPIIVNKIFEIKNKKTWILYKEESFLWKKWFYKVNEIISWLKQ